MELLKTAGAKVVGGAVALVVVISAISWWQMTPQSRHDIVSGAGKLAAWAGVVAMLPWATFFLIGKVGKMDSNAAGAALVLGYTVVEAVALAWLFGWHFAGASEWVFFAAAVLVSAAYNLLTCDWIAERFG